MRSKSPGARREIAARLEDRSHPQDKSFDKAQPQTKSAPRAFGPLGAPSRRGWAEILLVCFAAIPPRRYLHSRVITRRFHGGPAIAAEVAQAVEVACRFPFFPAICARQTDSAGGGGCQPGKVRSNNQEGSPVSPGAVGHGRNGSVCQDHRRRHQIANGLGL